MFARGDPNSWWLSLCVGKEVVPLPGSSGAHLMVLAPNPHLVVALYLPDSEVLCCSSAGDNSQFGGPASPHAPLKGCRYHQWVGSTLHGCAFREGLHKDLLSQMTCQEGVFSEPG